MLQEGGPDPPPALQPRPSGALGYTVAIDTDPWALESWSNPNSVNPSAANFLARWVRVCVESSASALGNVPSSQHLVPVPLPAHISRHKNKTTGVFSLVDRMCATWEATCGAATYRKWLFTRRRAFLWFCLFWRPRKRDIKFLSMA